MCVSVCVCVCVHCWLVDLNECCCCSVRHDSCRICRPMTFRTDTAPYISVTIWAWADATAVDACLLRRHRYPVHLRFWPHPELRRGASLHRLFHSPSTNDMSVTCREPCMTGIVTAQTRSSRKMSEWGKHAATLWPTPLAPSSLPWVTAIFTGSLSLAA